MKKILLLVLFLLILPTAIAPTYNVWIPSVEDNFNFNMAVGAGQDFNLYMKQTFWRSYRPGNQSEWRILGAFAPDGSILPPCVWGEPGCGASDWRPGPDTNIFGLPVGSQPGEICTLEGYSATNNYVVGGFFNINADTSIHEVTMTLNCTEGYYYIPAKYYIYVMMDWGDVWVFPYEFLIDSDPVLLTHMSSFRVLPDVDMPPFYDYNMFWSTVGDTNRHYIHAYDMNEFVDGNYFVSEFEVKVDPDCEIMGGGAKNLDKSADVGDWYKTYIGGSTSHTKFELLKKEDTFQEGFDGYSGCEDTYIDSTSSTTNFGTNLAIKAVQPAEGEPRIYTLIRFKNLGIPLGSIIESATLDMHAFYNVINSIVAAYPVWKYDWNKGAPDNIYGGATWERWDAIHQFAGPQWGLPGASNVNDSDSYNTSDGTDPDRKLTSENTVTLNISISNPIDAAWWSTIGGTLNVTESLQHQLDNNKWGGWLIKPADGEEGYVYSRSCNITEDVWRKPKLNVSWKEPPYSPNINPSDFSNLNLYVNVRCDSWGFKDFNVTITDADGHSSDFSTVILDINAYEFADPFIENEGPPGVNVGGPYFMGDTGFLIANAYGVTDYETDTNHFIAKPEEPWRICEPGLDIWCFFIGGDDDSCFFVDSVQTVDRETIIAGDYNYFIGGQYQWVYDQQFLVCDTPGQREVIFVVGSTAGGYFLDKADVYALDLRADLNEPYYAVVGEDTQITGLALDNDPVGNIAEAKWYAYDDCGPRTGWGLDDQTREPIGDDFNVTATINCSTTGTKAINLVIIADKEYYEGAGPVHFRGDATLIVINPDSLRMDSFEVVPPKVREGDDVNFVAVVKSKISPENPADLQVQVEFQVFDEEGNLIDTLLDQETISAGQQKEFKKTFNTLNLKENSPYRVTAMAYLLSGSGPLLDRQAINDVLEDHFWVMTADDKLQKLPETNYLTIMLVLVLVVLIFSRKGLK